jgi:hypothetical protein
MPERGMRNRRMNLLRGAMPKIAMATFVIVAVLFTFSTFLSQIQEGYK